MGIINEFTPSHIIFHSSAHYYSSIPLRPLKPNRERLFTTEKTPFKVRAKINCNHWRSQDFFGGGTLYEKFQKNFLRKIRKKHYFSI